jgi:4'-phosphopantetheinyl transferase
MLILHQTDVHVWRAALDMPASYVQDLWRALTADERQRAERYIFAKDCTHFVVARGLLRVLLGRYLRQDPHDLRFTYGPRGKPALAAGMDEGSLRFNVSHSHGLALYALTHGRDLGVDVERIRPEIVEEQVAERFFSPREVTLLRALPVSLQASAFFACWTRKEAYIKATGEGLALPLDQFDVSLTPGEPAALLRTAWDPQEALHWAMQDLDPAPGYRAAVAVAGHDWRLTCWDGPGAYLDVSTFPRRV